LDLKEKKLTEAGTTASWVDEQRNTTTRKTLSGRCFEYEGLGASHGATWEETAATDFNWGS
jgi:hypothetical protein